VRYTVVAGVVLGTLLSLALPASANPDIPVANAALAAVVKKAHSPGAGFAVADRGRIVDVKGFGSA